MAATKKQLDQKTATVQSQNRAKLNEKLQVEPTSSVPTVHTAKPNTVYVNAEGGKGYIRLGNKIFSFALEEA